MSDKKRNFFAHSGLLKNIVTVRKEADKIILAYVEKKDARREITEWLKNPEDL